MADHVTDKEAQAVSEYAYRVMTTLGMPHWKIMVMEEATDPDDCYASIDTVDGRYVARLYLCPDWMGLDSDVRRETITHEVLHLLHFRVNHVVQESIHLMHSHEYASLYARYQRETEYMVDHLAAFMARNQDLETAWDVVHETS